MKKFEVYSHPTHGLAAAHDHPQALYNLAVLHELGDGVPQDFVEAERL